MLLVNPFCSCLPMPSPASSYICWEQDINRGMRFEGTNEGAGTGRLGALQPPLSCYICWCSNSVSKKWQDNFSGKYITTNEGNYWWLSIEAGSPIGTEERLHWGRNILPSSFHSFLSSYELGTFTSCFHLHIKFQQNPKVVLWRNTKPNTPPQRRASTS